MASPKTLVLQSARDRAEQEVRGHGRRMLVSRAPAFGMRRAVKALRAARKAARRELHHARKAGDPERLERAATKLAELGGAT